MEPVSAADAQIKVRLNRDVRDTLKVRAAQNRRTLMREIEFRVIESLQREGAVKPSIVSGDSVNQGAPA